MTFKIDKTAMLLQGLGDAKTEAEELGTQLDNIFRRIEDAQIALVEHGISIGLYQITFERLTLQAAWGNYIKLPEAQPLGPPMMETEEQIVKSLFS